MPSAEKVETAHVPRWRATAGTIALALLAAVLVLAASQFLRSLAPGKAEDTPDFTALTLDSRMTLKAVAAQVSQYMPDAPELAPKLTAKALGVRLEGQAGATLAGLGVDPVLARANLIKSLALRAEHNSKDFKRIRIKFAMWIVWLIFPLVLLSRRRLTSAWRYGLLGGAVAIFGVALGSDPNPMGTVKDAIVLAGQTGAVFPPRLIALAVFLLLVIFANKFICSWGCQFGTLQELLYRLNRRGLPHRGALPLIRIPFKVSNAIRITVFAALTIAAVAWGFDLLGPIDPFRIFQPAALGWLGGATLTLILAAALFTYRPFCTLFCPFGLAGWLAERLSVMRVRVDYSACTACGACTKACPSEAMAGLLTGRMLPQDCFSCGDCLAACPTSAVKFTHTKGVKPSSRSAEIIAKLRKSHH